MKMFELGEVVITQNILRTVDIITTYNALERHKNCDWGELSDEEKAVNLKALKNCGELRSSYQSEAGIKFWIITAADRSVTTILLPEDN
ncbi:MAG: hypothetical protein FWD48_04055 [Oscillospiraceae bacterium]|nr:hypothetical protein [Oscillospiraceae bacterium]